MLNINLSNANRKKLNVYIICNLEWKETWNQLASKP